MGSKKEIIYGINSISELKDKGFANFQIPLYQRKYAWGSEEVKILLNDLYDFQEKISEGKLEDGEKYYIGNIVVEKDKNSVYQIIDGQQRFTTIYLMLKLLSDEPYFELDYTIRENDSEFLKTFTIDSRYEIEEKVDIFKADKQFKLNLDAIFDFFQEKNIEISNDVYGLEKLLELCKFTITVLPKDVDIVKYFEVMNNRGKQLEKHQILKAKFIDVLTENSEYDYAKIWDYCSNMNIYLDEQISYQEKYSDNNEDKVKIEKVRNSFDRFLKNNTTPEFFNYKGGDDNEKLKIINIIKEKKRKYEKEDYYEKPYMSIVKFPIFLIQVLKLYLAKNHIDHELENYKVNERYLLDYYLADNKKLKNTIDPKEFVLFLLKMRILFDRHIFKRDKDQKPVIYRHISLPAVTTREILNLELLFSYTSPQRITQDWISVALRWLSKDCNINNFSYDEYCKFLVEFDRTLAKTRLDDNVGLIEQINHYLCHKEYKSNSINATLLNEKLNKGVATPHYWFYKLDYILWKNNNWKQLDNPFSKEEKFNYDSIINDFRLSQMNSIEHIFPQSKSDEWGKYGGKRKIDYFGNLALISNHMNSSLSNVNENKKTKIQMQLDRGTIESLKMLLIYSSLRNSSDWTQEKCQKHQEEMMDLLYGDLIK